MMIFCLKIVLKKLRPWNNFFSTVGQADRQRSSLGRSTQNITGHQKKKKMTHIGTSLDSSSASSYSLVNTLLHNNLPKHYKLSLSMVYIQIDIVNIKPCFFVDSF